MSAKTFSVACVAAILLLIGSVGLFNRIVDPYWYFRDVDIVGFNHNKPKAPGNERLAKPAWVAKLKPGAVIVGNSAAEVGLPPTHRGFTRDGALVPFNLAIPRATWNETLCLALFVIRQAPVKRLVVGVSGADDGPCPDDETFARADYGKLLFSRAAFDASRETVRLQGQRATMTPEGLWYFDRYEERLQTDEDVARNAAVVMQDALCEVMSSSAGRARPNAAEPGAGAARSRHRIAQADTPRPGEGGRADPAVLSDARVVERSAAQLPGARSAVELAVAGRIHRGPGDRRQFTVGSGLAIRGLRADEWRANPRGQAGARRLWQDSIHFNEEVGAAVFDAIYLGAPHYGSQVTVDNFDALVTRSENERGVFLADNPWVAQELDEMHRRARGLGSARP